MQPIIRRMITITVTETWTITWPDGQETVWHTTQVVDSPRVDEASPPRSQLTIEDDDNDDDDNAFNLDGADPPVVAH